MKDGWKGNEKLCWQNHCSSRQKYEKRKRKGKPINKLVVLIRPFKTSNSNNYVNNNACLLWVV